MTKLFDILTEARLPRGEATKPDLVFQLWAGDSGIFLKKDDFVRLSAIHHALETARTWYEFERLCPEEEFESLSLWYQWDGEYVYEDDGTFRFIQPDELDDFSENCGRDYIITPEDEFDSSRIPGVEDGDYPPWLESTADELLPSEFRERFGEGVASPVAGAWTEYPVSEIEEMMRWLGREGFSVMAHLSYDWDGGPEARAN